MSKKNNNNNNYSFGNFIKDRIIVVLLLIIIPLIGMAVFIPLLCIDKIPVNDLGSFLGGLLAYIGTVLLGLISVWQNEKFKRMSDYKDAVRDKEIKEAQRLTIQPYLFCEYEEVKLDELPKMNKVEYIRVDEFNAEGNGYSTCYEVPSDIQQAFEEKTGYIQIRNAEKYLFIKLLLTNIGQAGAVDVLMEINGRKSLPPFSMVKEASKTIYVLFSVGNEFVGKQKIDFSFNYNDIQGETKYKQLFSIDLIKNEDDFVYTAQKKGISAPIIVGD